MHDPKPDSATLVKLPREFYLRPTLTVARDLLGKYFVRSYDGSPLISKIVEVEGYIGERDPASHAFRGQTKRNEVMFGEGGCLYVYFTYGMHFCCNVVTEEAGKGRAVLLRAVEPITGIEVMQQLRGFPKRPEPQIELTNGPAKLCKAYGIERAENGADLLGDEIFIAEGIVVKKSHIVSSTRIGITLATDKKWRYYIKGNGFVSKKNLHR